MIVTWSEYSRKKSKKLWERKTCLRDQAKTMISKKENVDKSRKKLTIELAVFLDKAAYHMYMPILDNDEDKLLNMILAYVNQIQAFFHHTSFATPVDILLVRLEVMEKQLSTYFIGKENELLSLFCNYASIQNPPKDDDPDHWDIGLYLTRIDLYKIENPQKYYDMIGMAYTNSSCTHYFSCAIVAFGTTGLNTPSGFMTSRAAARQIGHLLGINHDNGSFDSTCAKDKYMMADLQYRRGQIAWSECSRNIAKELWKAQPCLRDHTRRKILEDGLEHSSYRDLPGRNWTAKAQCQLFLRDKDANVITLHDICQVLQCETPHENKYFFAGPALDGTHCALEKECRGGECVPVIKPPLPYCKEDNWSEWEEDSCKSNCLTKSKGVVIKRRSCKHATYKTASCNGPYYDVVLCNDSSFCTKERKTIAEYTDLKCTEFSFILKSYYKEYFKYVPKIGPGQQNSHDVGKPWIACTIYCQREEKIFANYSIFYFYTPRLELLELDVNPYFPDGTWCHEKDGQDYYCRQHYCLPKNYSIEE
ncbi:A disintegrin and metalloproteinase with thrombospondin motifs 2-like [Linepithema humile]|uniref:A disintegrin and metalloproteinase with thrombospondin motifs 2-like n=1 Tax=Linepithema humile TaxID=83485 RepID=UPI00351DF177